MSNDKNMLESSRSREIVQEILNFGVSDFQIKKIIKFLSLELEDRKLMQEIVRIITEDLEEDSGGNKPRIQI